MNEESMESSIHSDLSMPAQPCSRNRPVYFMASSRLKHLSISFVTELRMSNVQNVKKMSAQEWKHEGKRKRSEFHGKRNETDSQVKILPYQVASQVKQTCQNTALPPIMPSYLNNASMSGELAWYIAHLAYLLEFWAQVVLIYLLFHV